MKKILLLSLIVLFSCSKESKEEEAELLFWDRVSGKDFVVMGKAIQYSYLNRTQFKSTYGHRYISEGQGVSGLTCAWVNMYRDVLIVTEANNYSILQVTSGTGSYTQSMNATYQIIGTNPLRIQWVDDIDRRGIYEEFSTDDLLSQWDEEFSHCPN